MVIHMTDRDGCLVWRQDNGGQQRDGRSDVGVLLMEAFWSAY
jgi:hypothetical protein